MIILNTRKRPSWLKYALEDVEGHGAMKGTFRERKIRKRYSWYAAYMKKLIEARPYTFEEVSHQEVWKKAMQE